MQGMASLGRGLAKSHWQGLAKCIRHLRNFRYVNDVKQDLTRTIRVFVWLEAEILHLLPLITADPHRRVGGGESLRHPSCKLGWLLVNALEVAERSADLLRVDEVNIRTMVLLVRLRVGEWPNKPDRVLAKC
jgi:hypothetical protein